MIELAEIFDEQMAVLGVWLSKSQTSIFAICIYRTYWKNKHMWQIRKIILIFKIWPYKTRAIQKSN